MKIENILLPTDFSECSYRAAELAAEIARGTGARLVVVHVLDVRGLQHARADGVFFDAGATVEALEEEARRELETFVEATGKDLV